MLRAHTTGALRSAVLAAVMPTCVQGIGIGMALSVVGACMQRFQTIVEKPV